MKSLVREYETFNGEPRKKLSNEELEQLQREASQPALPTRESITAEIEELRKKIEAKQMELLKL